MLWVLLALLLLGGSPSLSADVKDGKAAATIELMKHKHKSSSSSSSSSNSHYYDNMLHLETKQLLYNSGYYSFTFGPSGTPANENYIFLARTLTYLILTDCYCGGDTFQLYSGNQLLANVNGNCPGQTVECLNYQEDPNVCKDSAGFCSTRIVLDPGLYNLTLLVTNSIVGSGRAFVWIDQACNSTITGTFLPCCEVLGTYGCNYGFSSFY